MQQPQQSPLSSTGGALMTSKWTILAPIDLSRPYEEIVLYALSVAAGVRADVHLLYVVDEDASQTVALNWPSNTPDHAHTEIDVHRVVLHGNTATTIAEYADSIDANLIL